MTRGEEARLLDTRGVAELLDVHPKHVFRLLKRGLPGYRLGGEWRFEPEQVLAWMRAQGSSSQAPSPPPPPIVAANGDVCVEELLQLLSATASPVGLLQADSTTGYDHVQHGRVLAAGIHGERATTQDSLLRVQLTRRQIGVCYRKGQRLRSLRGVAGLRLASRGPTAGVRAHVDAALLEAGLDSAEIHAKAQLLASHREVVLAVLSGRVDAGIATLAWAERAGLGCLPIAEESYALGLRADALEHELGKNLLRAVQSSDFRRALGRSAGYDAKAAGTLL